MVSAIFASKLYQASSRKDRIHSAYMNPLNAELVQQIDSYVSPKYQKLLEPEEQELADSQNLDTANTGEDDDRSSYGSSYSGGGGSSFSGGGVPGMITDESDNSSGDDIETDDVDVEPAGDESSEPQEDESVEQSTVIASSCTEKDVAVEVDTIKGSLNVKDETSGVTRVRVKDKELWIYYQDSINLNSVMPDVIDTMNALGYTYLEFSRLARTDNAIVFDIYESMQPIQPLEDDNSDGKKEKAQYS